jgi:hypothetical protein
VKRWEGEVGRGEALWNPHLTPTLAAPGGAEREICGSERRVAILTLSGPPLNYLAWLSFRSLRLPTRV